MVLLGVIGLEQRRSRLPAVASLALHGAALWLLIALGGKHLAPAPRSVLTPIEIVQAALMPPPAPAPPPAHALPAGRPAASRAAAAMRARREPARRAQPTAPPAVQALASLQVRYEDPASFADHGPARQAGVTGGIGPSGIGAGLGDRLADGIGNLIPDAPAGVSHARSPRPKGDYRKKRIVGASRFAGQIIKLQLSIDERGRVRGVQVLQGVDPEIDRRTALMVRSFEFEPALDDAGVAIAGTKRCEYEIVEDDGSF